MKSLLEIDTCLQCIQTFIHGINCPKRISLQNRSLLTSTTCAVDRFSCFGEGVMNETKYVNESKSTEGVSLEPTSFLSGTLSMLCNSERENRWFLGSKSSNSWGTRFKLIKI